MDRSPAHYGAQVRQGGASGLIVRLVVPDGAQQHVPLSLPGVDGFLRGPPGEVGRLGALILVEPGGRSMDIARELGAALRPGNVGGEVVAAIRDVAAGHQCPGAVGECVLDGVAVEVLSAVSAASKAPADAMR